MKFLLHPWRADNFFYSYVVGPGFLLALIHPWRADDFFFSYVAGPGFLLALLSQGQVFCWPYCRRARFFAGPTASGQGFLLPLLSFMSWNPGYQTGGGQYIHGRLMISFIFMYWTPSEYRGFST